MSDSEDGQNKDEERMEWGMNEGRTKNQESRSERER